MERTERRFTSLAEAESWLEILLEQGRIKAYQIRPSYDEYGFDVWIQPIVPTSRVEYIDVTTFGSNFREYKIGSATKKE